MPLGIYISVPFCKSKCSYCNFASGVFSRERMQRYVDRVRQDMRRAESLAATAGGIFNRNVDSIYLGGGTPSILPSAQLRELFACIRDNFDVAQNAEITVECAPGTFTPELMETLVACGVNRVSLGVQSFVDQEARAVARLHTREVTLRDIANLRSAGISNINVDLIAGLPFQTRESWEQSLDAAIGTSAPHVSIYMLEVDEDSRLGRELIAGGQRYHAHQVPDSDLIADCYERACQQLESNGVGQYEISNFARPGFESRHNLKYWTRQPYLGFGLDAHSMLHAGGSKGARFSFTDELDSYLAIEDAAPSYEAVTEVGVIEEEFFLGLRLNRGIAIPEIEGRLGRTVPHIYLDAVSDLEEAGLLANIGDRFLLTARGRLLSNEVFVRFLGLKEAAAPSLISD
jgi:oxygen-independent coproporphyrinogen-3 oxidase